MVNKQLKILTLKKNSDK